MNGDPPEPVGSHEHDNDASAAAQRTLLRQPSRLARRCATAIGFLVALVVLAGAALALRLTQGPMTLPFMTDAFLEKVAGRLPRGTSFSTSEVALARHNGALSLVVENPQMSVGAGPPVLSAEAVYVGIDVLRLAVGAIEPTSVDIAGPRLSLFRDVDGHIMPKGLPPDPALRETGLGAIMAGVEASLEAVGTINAITATDVRISLEDSVIGARRDFNSFDVTIRRTAAPGGISLIATAQSGARLTVTSEAREDDTRYVEINGRDLKAKVVAETLVPGGPPPDIDARLGGAAKLRVSREGTILTGSLALRADSGLWLAGPHGEPFAFDEAVLQISYAGADIKVERASLRAGAGAASFTGSIRPPIADPATHDPKWYMTVQSAGLSLSSAHANEPPLLLDSAIVVARYDPRIRRVGIDRASFVGPSASLDVQGSVTFGEKAPGVGLVFVGSPMPVAALKRFWPFFAAVDARTWFATHVQGGTVERARVTLAIPVDAMALVDGEVPPLRDESIDGEFVISGAVVRPIPTLPPMTVGSTVTRFTGRTFEVSLESGEIVAGDQTLTVRGGTYRIEDLAKHPADTRATFKLGGPVTGLAILLSLEPFASLAGPLDVDPRTITGQAALDVMVAAPLGVPMTADNVDFKVSGVMDAVTLAGPPGRQLENATLTVQATPGSVSMSGKGTFAGLPTTLDFSRDGNKPAAARLSWIWDDAMRAKQNFALAATLSGPVKVEADVSQGATQASFPMSFDMSGAKIADLLPGWQKAAGTPGKGTFTYVPQPDGGAVIKDLVLQSGTVDIRGSATLDAASNLTKASLSSLKIQPGDSAQAEVTQSGGVVKISVDAKAFDVRGALQTLLRGGTSQENLDVSIAINKAVGYNDTSVTGLRLKLMITSSDIRKLSATGQFGDAPASADLGTGQKGEPLIQVVTDDAGSLMRFLNYYTKVRGGKLAARVTPDLNNAEGLVTIRDFAVRDEPAIAKFFSSARAAPDDKVASKVLRQADSSAGNSQFTKLRLSFARTPRRLTINEGVVWGPEVGASIAGMVDYVEQRVNITGTFVPAYALNNLFSQIPVLGPLLGGGQYGGLFAVTFRVAGPLAGPTLTVNPLSGIAPGFLRKLFEFQKE